jgi:hypothetical protein
VPAVTDLGVMLRYVLGLGAHVRASARKLDLDSAIVQVAHDIECGTHSGIPPCCIAWFMLVRRHTEPGSPEWLAYQRTLHAARPARRGHVGLRAVSGVHRSSQIRARAIVQVFVRQR